MGLLNRLVAFQDTSEESFRRGLLARARELREISPADFEKKKP